MFYVVLFIVLILLYAFALVTAAKASSTTMLIILIVVLLFALIATTFAALLIAVGDFIKDSNARRLRKYLLTHTASVRIRTLEGTITERDPGRHDPSVTVRVGQNTYFRTEDEDAFFASYSNATVRVKFREHRDAKGKVIHRELIRLIL